MAVYSAHDRYGYFIRKRFAINSTSNELTTQILATMPKIITKRQRDISNTLLESHNYYSAKKKKT